MSMSSPHGPEVGKKTHVIVKMRKEHLIWRKMETLFCILSHQDNTLILITPVQLLFNNPILVFGRYISIYDSRIWCI